MSCLKSSKQTLEQKKAIQQSLIQIFPIKPYNIQVQLALNLYSALNEGISKFILVESPTGTGKTYSLLVGVCKWLVDHPSDITTNKQNNISKNSLPNWMTSKSSNNGLQLLSQKKKQLQNLVSINQGREKSKKERETKLKQYKKRDNNLQSQIFDDISSEEDNDLQKKRKIANINLKSIEDSINDKDTLPKVIFVSRTHSQLKQVIESIQQISHQLPLLSLQMGSKNNLCINPMLKISHSTTQSIHEKCQMLLSHTGCSYFHRIQSKEFFGKTLQESYKMGEENQICPYYGLKNVMKLADILCIPYISILQENIRNILGINLKNSIIIFDEAHNVIDEELSIQSPQISYTMITSLCGRIQDYMEKYGPKTKAKNLAIIKHLNQILRCLLNVMKGDYNRRQSSNSQNNTNYKRLTSIQFIMEMGLFQLKINKIKHYIERSNFDKKIAYFKEKPYPINNLYQCIQFLSKLMSSNQSTIVLIKTNNQSSKQLQLNSYSLKFLTLQSNTLQNIIRQSKMTIFAGGTMYPIDQYYSLMSKYKNHTILTYTHNISKQQCQVYCINTFKQQKIVFNYQNNMKNKLFLFEAIQRSIDIIVKKLQQKYGKQKAGIVIFAQNYTLMQYLQQHMKQKSKLFDLMTFDSRSQKKINHFEVYKQKLQKQKLSILFSVMGGTLSQGINFSDQLARAIVVFGLPYASTQSPQLIEKMKFYDQKSTQHIKDGVFDFDPLDLPFHSTISGKIYYQNLCVRTLNQTIGRGIRHSKDRADIFLIDWRFQNLKDKLSLWLKQRVNIVNELQKL